MIHIILIEERPEFSSLTSSLLVHPNPDEQTQDIRYTNMNIFK